MCKDSDNIPDGTENTDDNERSAPEQSNNSELFHVYMYEFKCDTFLSTKAFL